ncbi:alpha/beta fold hydrolase [Kordia sp. TARA_039_SRF]|nr:alpha/beta fold hydrolase [Kordia sp. TARA_039_SRF]
MNLYSKTLLPLIVFFMFSFLGKVWAQNVKFEEEESFFPNAEVLKEEKINWGYLTVPENWEHPEKRKIKIAVSVLKNRSNKENADATVFIQGGPGASGVMNILNWLNHPIRESNDIVLVDIRGTGLSEPRLCPDLGDEFLEILAKNQSPLEDEKQKTAAAMLCKQELLNRGVDVDAYHSTSIANDLHALKDALKYKHWNVYGVSYGTYVAQVYANNYPDDVKSLILDSVIDNITNYYTENTSNYIQSLSKVFKECENDPECNSSYPELEKIYYETIAKLEKEPITVKVDSYLIDSGEFTYNAEDFKVAVQQGLYNKQLVEIIPLLIYQTYNRNEGALSNLVEAFSSLLNMDYGVYYCVSCNEALPRNEYASYEKNAAQFEKLKGGISFYKSDFKVCEQWNATKDSVAVISVESLQNASYPVLILSGGYDPITPEDNGHNLVRKLTNSKIVVAPTYGHTPGFTDIGNEVTKNFIEAPSKVDVNAYSEAEKVSFVSNIEMNAGISEMGTSLSQLDPFFIGPLAIAVFVMIAFVFIYTFNFIKKKYNTMPDKVIRILSTITSVIGIFLIANFVLAVLKVSEINYFILAFGLPTTYNYLFTTIIIFSIFLILTFLYFILKIKKIDERSIIFSVIFSNILLLIYMTYWGVVVI